jgi:hypothetical protein
MTSKSRTAPRNRHRARNGAIFDPNGSSRQRKAENDAQDGSREDSVAASGSQRRGNPPLRRSSAMSHDLAADLVDKTIPIVSTGHPSSFPHPPQHPRPPFLRVARLPEFGVFNAPSHWLFIFTFLNRLTPQGK